MFPLAEHTIFVTLAGSQAHGTAREGSDVDVRGVCIAPLSARLSLFTSFEQYEGELPEGLEASVLPRLEAHPTASRGLGVKTECVIFELAKFLGLCAAANPNALEILFVDEGDWVFETPAWRRIHRERRRFLTKKVEQTFSGYAMAQLRKIQTHRSRLLNPPKTKPAREDLGLPAAGGTLERRRNPTRAALEAQHGYDTKHAMHLIRLMRMGLEALERGELRVRRDDADLLVAIRDGAMSFEQLLDEATRLREAMAGAAATTTLPEQVDRSFVDELALELFAPR